MVSTSTAVPGAVRRTSRVASRPCSPGICRSMSTTSGAVLDAQPHRVGAVVGLGDDLDVLGRVEDGAQPLPHERVVVGEHASSVIGDAPSG